MDLATEPSLTPRDGTRPSAPMSDVEFDSFLGSAEFQVRLPVVSLCLYESRHQFQPRPALLRAVQPMRATHGPEAEQ